MCPIVLPRFVRAITTIPVGSIITATDKITARVRKTLFEYKIPKARIFHIFDNKEITLEPLPNFGKSIVKGVSLDYLTIALTNK